MILNHVLDILLPASCLLCKADLRSGEGKGVCRLCLSQLSLTPQTHVQPTPALDALFTLGLFEGNLRDLLHLFKYAGKDYLAPLLGGFLARHSEFSNVDVIVPVPMPFWREIKRGYNQAELLAQYLSTQWEIPVKSVFLKKKYALSQTLLSKEKRLKNAQKSIYARCHEKGKGSALLVDDVCTTGATLSRCAELLKTAGFNRVFAAAIAREPLRY